MGAHVAKAQGLKRHSRGPRPCNTEGTRGVSQTDKHMDFLCIIVKNFGQKFSNKRKIFEQFLDSHKFRFG